MITIGGYEFYDISGIVGADRYVRPLTDGLIIHHSVTAPIPLSRAVTLQEKLTIIAAIDAYHASKGWGGFGYQGAVFGDGTVMVVGQGKGARAHVANQNSHLEGLVMIGDYSTSDPPLGCLLGAAQWVRAKQLTYGPLRVDGHRAFADASDPTSCPGDAGERAVTKILHFATMLDEQRRLEAERAIRAALGPAWEALDLRTLHGQLHYLGVP